MKKYILTLFLMAVSYMIFAVPPCPQKTSGILSIKEYPSEIFSKYKNTKNSNVPDSILIIMVEFSDVKFRTDSTSFDGFNHDVKYFKKYMEHLSEYYFDASHGKYNLQSNNYTFYEHIITMPNSMAYYGNDEKWSERIALFFSQVIQAVDNDIDFNNFDSIIIFHAGAGQETDISGANSDDLWTTFITRKSLQGGLDPENDSFQGIPTNDNIFVKEAIIMPESEQQPDYTQGNTKYGLLGVLAHEFGHLLGLPTLFDNYSANGASAGIGNFGVMGTGVWNANGFVPPLPCAWSRYYLGWEDDNLIIINDDSSNNQIAYPMMNSLTPKLYKINISPKEYFLLENRQQNPDNSTIHGFPNFTFQLLPDSLQDYYPPPNDDVPVFNFMENSYAGCEWDFFLPGPGYGEPPDSSNETVNGSGIFIWHIDEYMIDLLFDPNFEMNYINYDASHKGVDLEEACGYQYLDKIESMDSFGTPYESYREGNNTYFGYQINPLTGLNSFPTAESYYGGINLEIYDVSASANIMSFSVRFAWNLNPNYNGAAKFPPLITKFRNSQYSTIVNILPDGHIFLWDTNEELNNDLSLQLEPIEKLYAFDEISGKMILPVGSNGTLAYYTFSNDISDFNRISLDLGYHWATNPVVNPNGASLYRAFLPLNSDNSEDSKIVVLDNSLSILTYKELTGSTILTNMMLRNDTLYTVLKTGNDIELGILNLNDINSTIGKIKLTELANKQILSAITADMNNNGKPDFIITDSDSLLYLYDNSGNLYKDFPIKINLNAFSIPSISDVDGNGEADILIGGENSFLLVNKTGKIARPYLETSYPDSLCKASGVLGFDINNDGKTEVIGNFSKNRLAFWSFKNLNDFTLLETPISYREFSPFAPVIANYSSTQTDNSLFVFVATNNGLIFRKKINKTIVDLSPYWYTDLANYQRTASYSYVSENNFKASSVFVNSQTYIYPNPLSKIYTGSIFGGNKNENKIAVKFMLSVDKKIKMQYFNANGELLGTQTKMAVKNYADVFYIDANKLSSGVYFCILSCDNHIKKFKFAIEK